MESKWQREEEAKSREERRQKVKEDENRRKEAEETKRKEAEAKRKEAEAKRKEEEERRKEEEERRKAEEIKKKEEEAKKKEEEEARKAAEEKERLERDKKEAEEKEKKELEDYVSETRDRLAEVTSTREANTMPRVAEKRETFEENSAKLDSSLKKNSGFVKKLKTMTEAQKDGIFKEILGLNLTKYVGECAAAIVEAKIKMADLAMAKEVCCMLHQRYAEFPGALLENWQKVLVTKKDAGGKSTSSSGATNASAGVKDAAASAKLKLDVKFFADLITLGVLPEKEALPTLGNVLTCLIANDKEEHLNVTTVISFLKHNGQDYCGLMPRAMRALSEKYAVVVPRSEFFEENRQKVSSAPVRMCKF